MKKQLIALITISLLVCTVSSWLAYRRGLLDGFVAAEAPMEYSNFAMSFESLGHLRNGRSQAAIERIEPFCYSSALSVLQLGYQEDRPKIDRLLKELLDYRARYAKPLGQWTPAEKALMESLRKWQSGEATETPLSASEIARLSRDIRPSK